MARWVFIVGITKKDKNRCNLNHPQISRTFINQLILQTLQSRYYVR